jgi:ferrous iron transport protein A
MTASGFPAKDDHLSGRRTGKVKGPIKLSELQVGESAEIVHVGSIGEIKKRLLEMGVVKGSRVKVERLAPLGDPMEVRVMGYLLSLRHSEAEGIEVRKAG